MGCRSFGRRIQSQALYGTLPLPAIEYGCVRVVWKDHPAQWALAGAALAMIFYRKKASAKRRHRSAEASQTSIYACSVIWSVIPRTTEQSESGLSIRASQIFFIQAALREY